MAGLTLKDIRKGRITTFITKMEEGVKTQKPEYMFTKNDGRKVILRTMQYNPGGKIVYYEIMKHKKVIADLLSGTTTLPNLKFTDITGNETLTLGDILKTEEFGGKANRGDITEIIFSAAIAARFMKRSKAINAMDVEWVLKHMNDTNASQKFGPWKTENEQKGVFDQVYWSFNAPIITVKTLAKATNRKSRDILKVMTNAINFANSEKVKKNIESSGKNNKANIIEISATGTIAQSETSVDVKVKIDGKPISLIKGADSGTKSSDKLIGGGGYQKQQELWMWLTSTEVSKAAIDGYTKKLGKGIPAAIYNIYFEIGKTLDRKFHNPHDPIYSALAHGMMYLANKKDPLIVMPSLTNGQLKMLQNDNLKTAMMIMGKKFKTTVAMVSGIPTLDIKDSAKSTIFLRIQFRKVSGGVDAYKNIIEKGPAFDQVAHVLK